MIALSIPLLLQNLQSSAAPPYAVGDCVVQDGQQPRETDCDEPGAYEIVLEVDEITECPDYPAEPAITVSEPSTVYCLLPAATADGAPGDSADGSEDAGNGEDGE